jgi:CDGSH-type Zn-finger protein
MGPCITASLNIGALLDLDLVDLNEIPDEHKQPGNNRRRELDTSEIVEEFVKENFPGLVVNSEHVNPDKPKYFLCFSGESDEYKFCDGAYSIKSFETVMEFATSEKGVKLFEVAMKKLNQKFDKKIYVFPIIDPDY